MRTVILLVDDEPRITGALMRRLEATGYTVRHAINGLAGVEAAALERPDLIIMDMRMPDIDGCEACQRIRSLPGCHDIPIVFLTANAQEANRRRAMAVGAVAFLSKPFHSADVIKVVNTVTASTGGMRNQKEESDAA